jgi:hypothetical protein
VRGFLSDCSVKELWILIIDGNKQLAVAIDYLQKSSSELCSRISARKIPLRLLPRRLISVSFINSGD